MVHAHPGVNLMFVCMMNSNADKENIREVQDLVGRTNEGSFMIVRYKLESEFGATDLMDSAFERIKNAIKLYPNKVVPVIQEELDF